MQLNYILRALCKCCPMSLFIEGWQWMLTLLLLKCQKCKSKTLWIYNYQISLSRPHPFSIPIAVSIFLLWISSFKSSKYLVIPFCISVEEQSLRPVTFETFDQNYDETWPDQQMKMTQTKTSTEHLGTSGCFWVRSHSMRVVLEEKVFPSLAESRKPPQAGANGEITDIACWSVAGICNDDWNLQCANRLQVVGSH